MNITIPWVKKLIVAFIILNIFLSAWYVIHGDILFHTDVARDFLVMDDIVQTGHLTLIGPRAGGITGVFHGPLWFYLNLPIFILFKENPVAIGWFWILLSALSLLVTYLVAKKMYDETTALIATLLVSLIAISYTNNLFNPFGALFFFPIYFYLFIMYLEKNKLHILLSALFIVGVIIQFQMAFGVPLLFLTMIYLVKYLHKKKKLIHLTALGILLIPLSSFILFDIKHSFLQFRSVIIYLLAPADKFYIFERVQGLFYGGSTVITYVHLLAIPVSLLLIATALKRNVPEKYKVSINYFYFLYIGFWIVTLAFRGRIENYYVLPFLTVMAMMVALARTALRPIVFCVLLGTVLIGNYYFASLHIRNTAAFVGKHPSSWLFNLHVAQHIEKHAPKEFGYYIFTPDQFGYIPRFAMNYVQLTTTKKMYPYQKKPTTYIIIQPPPDYLPSLNGTWWLKNSVNIKRRPDALKKYSNNEEVMRYNLSLSELQIPSDPNIINGLQFR